MTKRPVVSANLPGKDADLHHDGDGTSHRGTSDAEGRQSPIAVDQRDAGDNIDRQ